VSESALDAEELEAIQDAIREAAPKRGSAPNLEPTRLALITDDRIVEAARPLLITLATRWVRKAAKALRSHLPGQWQLDVVGAEAIDGAMAKEELRGGWIAGGKSPGSEVVFAVHGPVIDIAAARRCGASAPPVENTRTPSRISLRLFQPVGRALFDSWAAAWPDMFDQELTASSEIGIVQRLIESRTVIRLSLAFSGAAAGRVQVYTRPESLLPKPAVLQAIHAKTLSVATALAGVPVEVVAELGTLRMTLGKIRTLEVGSTHSLPSFVDSRVPIFCAGVLKAWGKPVVCRGVLAVQIVSVVHGQGQD
jgi:flagellar motor switch/type III secretory pathway protein FliN